MRSCWGSTRSAPASRSSRAARASPGRYRDEDLALVDEDVPRVVLGAGTDPMAARYAGLPAVSILSWTDGGFTNYHLPTDTADRVSWESVERCLALADRTIRRWHAASPAPAR